MVRLEDMFIHDYSDKARADAIKIDELVRELQKSFCGKSKIQGQHHEPQGTQPQGRRV